MSLSSRSPAAPRTLLALAAATLALAAPRTARAAEADEWIPINSCREHGHDYHFSSWSADHYRWTSGATGTALVWFSTGAFTSGDGYGRTNAGAELCHRDLGVSDQEWCEISVTEGSAYQASPDMRPWSSGNHTTCIYGVTIDAPGANATVTTTTPTFSGGAPAASVVTVRDGATVLCSATATASNTYSCTSTVALSQGSHTVVATAQKHGSNLTASRTFTVDSVTSVAISSPTDGQSFLATAPTTATGSIEAGATLSLYLDGSLVCTRNNGQATWSCALPAMADGSHTLVAQASDPAGNSASDSHAFTVRTATTMSITTPVDGETYGVGPAYAGTAHPGASVIVEVDNVSRCSTTANVMGAWSCAAVMLSHGPHAVEAIASENGMTATATITIAIDAQTVVAITGPTGETGASPTITGTGEVGATIAISLDGGAQEGSVTVGAGGTWSWPVDEPLGDGAHSVSVLAIDAFSNTAVASAGFVVNTASYVDLTSPVDGALLAAIPTISGVAEPGTSVTVAIDGGTVCTTTAAPVTGAFSCTVAMLADGTHSVTATASDGTYSAEETVSFRLDRATTVTITTPNGQVTTATPAITGTGEAGASLIVTLDGVTLAGTVTVAGDGTWSRAVPSALADGSHTIEVLATDLAGNTATASRTFTVNTGTHVAIATPVDGATLASIPTISGTAEPGVVVTVKLDGATICTPTAAAGAGSWTCTPASIAADGSHTVVASVNDGTFEASDTVDFALDRATTVAITAPTGETDDTTPTVTGTGEVGASVQVSIDGGAQGATVTVGAGGTWSWTVPVALAQGAHTVAALATDALGNGASANGAFVVNTGTSIAITAPVDGSVRNTVPTVTGVAERGVQVTVALDGNLVCSLTADVATGAFSGPLGAAPLDGLHQVEAVADDGTFQASASVSFTLDRVTTVTITGPVGPTGATPLVTGTGEAGATIAWSIDGGAVTGTTTVLAGGTWSFTVPVALSEGSHALSVVATDALSNTATANGTILVNTETMVDILSPAMDAALAAIPTISGVAEPSASVTVTVDGALVCTTTAHAVSGTFTCDPGPLVDGAHVVVATANDGTNEASDSVTFTLDRATTVTITAPLGPTGATPTITGTGEVGATIAVSIDAGAVTGTTTVQPNGTWSFEVSPALAEGSHALDVTATDALSNTATASRVLVVNTGTSVMITAPADGATLAVVPTVTGVAEPGVAVTVKVDGATVCALTADAGTGAFACDPGAIAGDGAHTIEAVANDGQYQAIDTVTLNLDRATTVAITAPLGLVTTASPTVTGTGEPGATVVVTVDGSLATGTVVVGAGGTFTYPIPVALANGAHTVTANATDALGNTASDTETFSVDLDTTITIDAPADGALVAAPPTVTGTAEPGVSVTIAVDGTAACSTAAHATTGAFSCAIPSIASDGVHTIVATANDGNHTATDSVQVVLDRTTTVDVTGPTGFIGDATPVIVGTGEPGATVSVRVDGVLLGTATVAVDGAWDFQVASALADGAHAVQVSAEDLAGNVDTATGGFTVDTSIPVLTITYPANGSHIDETTPEMFGTANPGATVMLALGAQPAIAVVADGLGIWRHTPPAPLAEGVHVLNALVTGLAGQTSTASSTFTIDVTAPAVAILAPENASILADAQPTVIGTAEPGAGVVVRIDGVTAGSTVADGFGDFQVALGAPLADGMHEVTATAADVTGNTATAAHAFVVDTVTTVVITAPAHDAVIGASAPTITGTGEVGATVAITIDGTPRGTTVVAAGGTWSFASPALADGAHEVVAEATDLVGNVDEDAITFTIDPALRDSDGDGISDADERPGDVDRHTDDDGAPDHLDPDDDGDGIPTAVERPGHDVHTDGDGAPDHLDPDDDDDGVPTLVEAPDATPVDTDSDETPDHHDTDDDGDGIPTADERPDGMDVDTDGDDAPDHLDSDDDGDGIPTTVERMDGETHGDDVDGDGLPNHLDTDADGDTVGDGDEGRDDANGNGVPNYLDPGLRMAGGARCAVHAPGAGGDARLAGLALLLGALVVARRRRRGGAALALFAAASLAALSPAAASAQTVAVNAYRPPESSLDGFALRSPEVPGHLRLGARLFLDYANDPLVLEAGQGDATVERASIIGGMLTTHLAVSLGVLDRLLVFAGTPVILAMSGDDASALGTYPAADGAGAGDPFVGARVRLLGAPDERIMVGAQARVALPLAHLVDDGSHYSGDASVSSDLVLSLRARFDHVRVLVNLGALLRSAQEFPNQVTGSRLTYGAGVQLPFLDEALVASVELFGAVGLADFGARASSPVEGLAGIAYHADGGIAVGAAFGPGLARGIGSPDFRAVATVGYSQPVPPPPGPNDDDDGDGVINAADACPEAAEDADGFEDDDGCPDTDNDGDGVPDATDAAPDVPEDADGFEDEDGAPELDNDGDGFPDASDACPLRAEDLDELMDDDGCPEEDADGDRVLDRLDHCPLTPGVENPQAPECAGCPELACLRDDGTIEIHDRVEFEFGNERILPSSDPVLFAVRDLVQQSPQIRVVRIEGHTDNVGADTVNMDLSQRRARSVREWLVAHGIDSVRVTAYGCGENVARRSNETEEGRQENRRVEFHVVDPPPNGRGPLDTDRCRLVE